MACQSVNKDKPGEILTITSIEMKNMYGDSTLIQYKDYDILIDSGTMSDANHIKDVLNKKVVDKKIELLVLTHPHGDHIGGIVNNCLSNMNVDTIVDYGYTYQTDGTSMVENINTVNSYTSIRDEFVANGTKYYGIKEALKSLSTVYIDKAEDCYLRWLKHDYYLSVGETFPNEKIPSDNPNTTSVSCYVHYKHYNIILCGDADSMYTEMSIELNYEKLFKKDDRNILKATHHAASSSNGSNFLDWCHPELIYISSAMVDAVCAPNQVKVGSGSDAQTHPNKSSLKRLLNATDNVYWNGINGDLSIKIDGINDYKISGSIRSKDYLNPNGEVVSKEAEKDIKFKDSVFYEYYK